MMANTLYLLPSTWDLAVDASGNIALAQQPYSDAQDAATACRLFQGEYWYDTTQGVPYWQSILGQPLSIAYIKSALETAALTVTDIVAAVVFISKFQSRAVSGQLQVTNIAGTTMSLEL